MKRKYKRLKKETFNKYIEKLMKLETINDRYVIEINANKVSDEKYLYDVEITLSEQHFI